MPATTTEIAKERRKRNTAQGSAAKKAKKTAAPSHFVGGPQGYYLLLIAVAILLSLGTLMVVSASSGESIINQVAQQAQEATDAGKMAGLMNIKANIWGVGIKHIISIVLGILVAWALSRINYREYKKYLFLLGAILLALLVAVAAFGYESNGAKRWIIIAGQSIQPSEFAKPILFLIMCFTMYRVRELGHSHMKDFGLWGIPAAFVLLCSAMIFIQPETGNILILYIGIFFAYMLLELPADGLIKALIGLGGVGVGFIATSPYRMRRVAQFLGFGEKNTDAAWQVKQAQLAFGSGGLTGVGPGLSRQKYFYLPEAQNDFIIAIIGEELGFLGVLTVIAAFGLMLYAGFRIAYQAKDTLGRALAGGSLAMLIGQAILNIFSVTGLGPVTGKPLPFVTLGGSSMITSFILLGIILSVARFGNQHEGKIVGKNDPYIEQGFNFAGFGKLFGANGERAERTERPARTTRPSRPNTEQPEKPERPKRPKQPAKKKGSRRPSRRDNVDQSPQEDFDEDSLEWRWDSGAHLSSPRRRR